jgi:hypothetical protein
MVAMVTGTGAAMVAHENEYRLPMVVVLPLVTMQCALVAYHVTRLNMLTGLYGLVLTSMVIIGELLHGYCDNLTFTGYLTEAQFTDRLNALAMGTLVATSCLYHACALFWGAWDVWRPRQKSQVARRFAEEVWSTALVISVFLIAATVGGATIMQHPYASVEARAGSGVESSGLSLGATYLLVMALVWAVRAFGYHSRQTLLVVLVGLGAILFFRSLRGDRGGTSIFLGAVLFIFYMYSDRPRWQKNLVLLAGGAGVFAYFQALGYARTSASYQGLGSALSEGFDKHVMGIIFPEEGFDPTQITLLPGGYWHLLHSIDLYHQGVSQQGASFLNLIPQALPDFIARWLNYERPISVAWRLAEHRANGGGLFLIAEGYWNLGLAGALLLTVALARAATALETWQRKQDAALMGPYLGLAGLFMYGMFYTLQTMVRGWEISLIMVLVVRYMISQHGRRSGLTSTLPPLAVQRRQR